MAVYTASGTSNESDGYHRAKATINILTVTPVPDSNATTVTWQVVISDGNSSYGGYNYNSPNGAGGRATGGIDTSTTGASVSGTTSLTSSYGSYDFGSGVIGSPYFPRTFGTYTATVTHNSSSGAATVRGSAGFTGGTGPAGTASANTGYQSLTTFASPAIQSKPTVSRVSGTPTSISITMTAPSLGSASLTRYEYSYSTDGSTWSSPISTGTSLTATKTGLTSTQAYYVRTRAITWDGGEGSWGYGDWQTGANLGYVAGVPSAPQAPTISNVVTTSLTLSWTAPANNGATISSYTIQGTTNGGTTWSNIATGVTGTTKNLTDLTIAATYKFRILAINSSGTSAAGAESAEQFISAYGYRFTSPTAKTAIKTAARYTGSTSDSITVDGTVYTKWKAILNIKKYNGTSWNPLEK